MQTSEATHDQQAPGFRLDVPLHSPLTQPGSRAFVAPAIKPERLPDPVFPQHPDLLGDDGLPKRER